MKIKTLVLSLVSLLPMFAWSQNELTYTVTSGGITITGYSEPQSSITNVVIPATINGISVTSVGGYAFDYCTNLTSLVIGNRVGSIGYNAFDHCSSLTNVIIPNSVLTIGDHAFDTCSSLTSAKIGNGVTTIGDMAFSYCTNLTSCVMGTNVLGIGDYAFYNCTSLTNLVFPDKLIAIGDWAFGWCDGVDTIAIPDHVTGIGEFAFYGSGAVLLDIGNSATNIPVSAFANCTGLGYIRVAAGNPAYTGSADGVWFDKAQTTLILCPALYIGSFVVPGTVTNIADSAFENCAWLTKVEVPRSVFVIWDHAFDSCSRLTNLTFFGDAPALGDFAFAHVGAGAKVYYYYGTSGWSSTYGGLPTVMLLTPPKIGGGGYVGIQSGKFHFAVKGAANQNVTVEVSENLVDWVGLQEMTLSGANDDFGDSEGANHPRRFYRVRTGNLPTPPTIFPYTVTNLSAATDNQANFMVTVPAGKTSLQISTSGGTGDCDLYVRFGSPPTLSTWDYRPYRSGNNESVNISNPAAGNWYIMLHAYQSYSGLTLQAQ